MARSTSKKPPAGRPARSTATAASIAAAADDERRFADEVGFFWEQAGGTRMAGRVLGALLLADPPEMSSSALAAVLGVSAGSVSTATRELINPGVAVRVRVPGERQDFFRADMGASALPQFLSARLALTHRWVELMQRGAALAVGKNPGVKKQLEEIRDLYEFLEEEQAGLVERWEERQRQRRGR
jgi:DNA-binding transcriptional regulator GbsR (MarR family)